jgi:hypothetical protein
MACPKLSEKDLWISTLYHGDNWKTNSFSQLTAESPNKAQNETLFSLS